MNLQKNYPYIKTDANGRDIQDSSGDMAFRGDYVGGNNLIYKGFARPGSATSSPVWQLALLAYSSDNLVSITWPQDANGNASSNYEFIYDNRASYTYS